ncbi:5'-nucleotidase, lipoprotein e(P4) family [Mangrovivirga sp. M17]|uniref:5'-nucleotidase, lipoprotein e(P4) family n=1 Tax=Mangrovivirga halotolerans TaxID=2993936 RepID=A0ABT3RN01_9BACT|nr:5'-nucleotidase, lipoprotein e(P4) family [Mangrovivirga halotolerans]MCX2743195.1 5'-nucleotidase, lipoprotein e(P4) family [Mangrovivirga halotolerans]
MKTKLILLIIILTSPVYGQKKSDYSEQNINATLWYQKSGENYLLYQQLYDLAKYRLIENLSESTSEMPKAVVLDLDETVLDNSPYNAYLITTETTYSTDTWNKWANAGTADALPGALDFTNFAMSLGVEVFYISNRNNISLDGTIENLKNLGFPNADKEHVFLKIETSDKTIRRNKVKEAYDIILFLGDNLRDYKEIFIKPAKNIKELVDDYKEELLKFFIVFPNPMYGEWESESIDHRFDLNDKQKTKMKKENLDAWE